MWQLPALAARAFAPGTAKCEANSTFIVETGGRLAPSATAILRSWAHAQVAAATWATREWRPLYTSAVPVQLVQARAMSYFHDAAAIDAWHACHLHQAAEWLAEDLGRIGPGGLTCSFDVRTGERPSGSRAASRLRTCIGPAQASSAL